MATTGSLVGGFGANTRGRDSKKRPCVILQADLLNRYSNTAIVAPILPDFKDWPFAVNIKKSKHNGLDKDRHINIKQMRAVSLERFSNKQGEIEYKHWPAIQKALQVIFGLQL